MKCYIYCTKAKPYLLKIKSEEVDFMCNYKQWLIGNNNRYQKMAYNGKIVASFDLNKVEEIYEELYGDLDWQHDYLPTTDTMGIVNLEQESCLDREKISKYLKDGKGYAWHIENLEILDKPIDFGKHTHDNDSFFYTQRIDRGVIRCGVLIKAPQSWQYVYDRNLNKCILISIKPEWVCKILNGEKTIEVRKTAPKELIK